MVEIALVWLAVVQTLHLVVVGAQGWVTIAKARRMMELAEDDHRRNIASDERMAAAETEYEQARMRAMGEHVTPVSSLPFVPPEEP